jgi:lysophospholipase
VVRFQRFLEDVSRVLTRLEEADMGKDLPVFLVGQSMGGLVALRFALERETGLRGLVLAAPWLATALRVPAWKRGLGRVAARVVPPLTLSSGVRPEMISRDPEEARAYAGDPLVHDRISARLNAEVGKAQLQVLQGPSDLKVPALFLVPQDDPLVEAGVTLRYAGSRVAAPVQVRQCPKCRHEPFRDPEKDRVIRTVTTWLEGRLDGERQAV